MESRYNIDFYRWGGGGEGMRIGWLNKGKRDNMELIRGWKGQCLNSFGAEYRLYLA